MALDIGFDTFGLLIKAGLRPGRKVMSLPEKTGCAGAQSDHQHHRRSQLRQTRIAIKTAFRGGAVRRKGFHRYERIESHGRNNALVYVPPNLSLFPQSCIFSCRFASTNRHPSGEVTTSA